MEENFNQDHPERKGQAHKTDVDLHKSSRIIRYKIKVKNSAAFLLELKHL